MKHLFEPHEPGVDRCRKCGTLRIHGHAGPLGGATFEYPREGKRPIVIPREKRVPFSCVLR